MANNINGSFGGPYNLQSLFDYNLNFNNQSPFSVDGMWGSTPIDQINWQNAGTRDEAQFDGGPGSEQVRAEYRPEYLARVLGSALFNRGYSGRVFADGTDLGHDNGRAPDNLSPEFNNWLTSNGYSLRGASGQNSNNNLAGLFDRSGKLLDARNERDPDSSFAGQAFTMMLPALGAVAGIPAGGFLDKVFQGMAKGGPSTLTMGGDFTKGALGGGLGGAANFLTNSFNPAGKMGIESAKLGSVVNKAIASLMTGLASGENALKSVGLAGLTEGITQGGRSLFDPAASHTSSGFSQASDMSFANNASYPDGVVPGVTEPTNMLATLTGQEPQQYPSTPADPIMGFGPSVSNVLSNFTNSQEQVTSAPSGEGGFNLSSLPQFAQRAINWGANNLGDVAGGLYGMYTQRKNMKNLKSQMAGLQGLYDSNGAYAKQLRRTLERKDAQGGRRSDYAGRETQLMAALAQGAAQTAPGLFQMQGAQGQLRNQRMMDMLRLGQRSGLFDMFKTQPKWGDSAITNGLNNMFTPQPQLFGGFGG